MTHRRALICVLTVLGSLVLLGLILFSDHGFYDLLRLRNQQNRLVEGNDRIAKENYALSVEIERRKTDPTFIEDVARRELGMVGKDDLIIRPRNTLGR
jgi:cell division protein FtsB